MSLIGLSGVSTSPEERHSDSAMDNSIESVVPVDWPRGYVKVTGKSGWTSVVKDDGSFTQWTGEHNG